MGKKLIYKETDFTVLKGYEKTGDKRIAYQFNSKDGKITANFFFEPGNVQTRGLILDKDVLHIIYPLTNPINNPQKIPDDQDILISIIKKLKNGEY